MTQKGWFKKLIAIKKGQYSSAQVHVARHHDMSLYSVLQPTGILYGSPIKNGTSPGDEGEQERLKQILVDSLINSVLFFRESEIQTEEDYEKIVSETPQQIKSFYLEVYPEYGVSATSFFGKKIDDAEVCEKVIQNRVYRRPGNNHNFWTHVFYNALVFLDVYLFSQWINLKSEKIVTEYFKIEKEELRLTAIKIMAAAAKANNIIEMSEQQFFETMLQVAQISKEREKIANKFFLEGVEIEEITLPQNNSWLLKKFFLEIAILMVWADREIDEGERKFLERFAAHLGFFNDDLDKSMIAIEGFLLTNWEGLEFKDRQDQDTIYSNYVNKISTLAQRNESRILKQIENDEALQRLLDRFRDGQSSSEDEVRLKNSLCSILQQLPSLKSVLFPTSVFTLPALLQLMPKSISAKG